MSETNQQTTQGLNQRSDIINVVDRLIEHREQVLVSYCLLAGVSDVADAEKVSVQPHLLRPFTQLMIDYLAMGHFEIYQRIQEGKERREAIRAAAIKVGADLFATTEFLVAFNDKYDAFDEDAEDLEVLAVEIPKVGQALVLRSQLEDRILTAIRHDALKAKA